MKISRILFAVLAATALAIIPIKAGTAYAADLPTCTIHGTAGADVITGTAGDDVICTGGGNDVIYALDGNDIVIVEGGGTVSADLGNGDDAFYGGVGLIQYNAIVNGGEGDDTIYGTPGDDTLNGDAGDDTIYGGEGADTISGGYGNDNLQGQNGADIIYGSAGDDDINGGWGSDALYGQDGNDSLIGGYSDDNIYGGSGSDYLQGDAGNDTISGESGSDSLAGGSGDDIISGGDGTDVLEGGWGLNLCDYSTGEIKGNTCRYDDSAPTILSATWGQGSYETGSSAQTVSLNIHITDDVAVRYVEVHCGDFFYATKSWDGFQKDVTATLSQTLMIGQKNGIFSCTASGYDQVNNRFSQQIASLQLTRGVGNWDDEPPVIVDSFWDPATYDVSNYAKTGNLQLHITDRTGINNVSLQCDDLWAWAYNLGTDLNNSSFATVSGSAKDFSGSLKLEIPYGHKPGSFQCNMWVYDKNNNLRYQQVAPLVITRDYGIWDEQAPVVEYGVWNQSKFDAGQVAQPALLSLHITDTSGVKNLYVSCAGVFYTPLYNLNVNDLANNPAVAAVEGDRKDLSITFANTILLGQYPGVYPCQVWGVDDFNNSFWSPIDPLTVWRTPPGLPNEPTNFGWQATTATAGVLSWTAPTDKGSPTLRDYVVQYSTDGSQTWKTIEDGYSTTPNLPISNLQDNTNYTFRVRGENGGGIDDYTSQYIDLAWAYLDVHTESAVVPNAPTGLQVSNTTKSGFQLNWTTPALDGGASITDFSVELSRNNGATWVSAKLGASTSQQLTVSGAAPGTTYLVRVAAMNRVGSSEYLTGSVTTLVSNASKPLNLHLTTQTAGRASINWDLPATNGGAYIADYKVEVTSGTVWTAVSHNASNTLGFTLTGLAKGKSYKVRVTAVTSIGLGDVSDVLSFVADTTAPGSPTGLTVGSITKSSVALGWVTPADTGGLAVSDYLVETSADNGYSWSPVAHSSSNSTKMTLSNLAGVTTYLVRVSAKNATGVGEAAYETFTTLAGSPSAPRSLSATQSDSGATLTWLAPLYDNGATLADYKIEASNDGGVKWATINHSAFVGEGFAVTGLKAGTSYKFRVSAINSLGQGDLSNVATVLTAGLAPSAPSALKATTKTTTTVTLSWSAAKVVGGSPVREYIVEYSKNKGSTWIQVSATNFKSLSLLVRGFRSKTTYLFRVSARNDVGISASSNVVVVGTR